MRRGPISQVPRQRGLYTGRPCACPIKPGEPVHEHHLAQLRTRRTTEAHAAS
ncbi:MAG: SAF domain-containing protein [Hyphomicrobiaceae bacterium]